MKNKYVLFIDNNHSYGPFNLATMNVLEFDKDAENKSEQLKELMDHIGHSIVLTETNGNVICTGLMIESLKIKQYEEPTVNLQISRNNW